MFPDASVRLELPIQVGSRSIHVDICIRYRDEIAAVELKYKTRDLTVDRDGERYRLKNQSAQDTGRYDFIRDIQRLEHVVGGHVASVGYAILLTNDSSYWTGPGKTDTVDAKFRVHDARILEGELGWGPNASDGTMKGREKLLKLRGRYVVEWMDFSRPSDATYGTLRSLTIAVADPVSR